MTAAKCSQPSPVRSCVTSAAHEFDHENSAPTVEHALARGPVGGHEGSSLKVELVCEVDCAARGVCVVEQREAALVEQVVGVDFFGSAVSVVPVG